MFHRTVGAAISRPLQAVAIPATFPTTHCGTGGDKPRPYGKSESVSVGAGFIARPWGSRDFHKASPQRYPVRAAIGRPQNQRPRGKSRGGALCQLVRMESISVVTACS